MVKFNWLHKRTTNGGSSSVAGQQAENNVSEQLEAYRLQAITGSISDTTNFISDMLAANDDFILRNFQILNGQRAAICYLSSLTSESFINTEILKPLMNAASPAEGTSSHELHTYLSEQVLYQCTIRLGNHLAELVEAILRGHVIVVIDQLDVAYILGSRHIAKRSISQPSGLCRVHVKGSSSLSTRIWH